MKLRGREVGKFWEELLERKEYDQNILYKTLNKMNSKMKIKHKQTKSILEITMKKKQIEPPNKQSK